MRDVFRVMTSDRSGHNDYFPFFFFVLECAEMRLPVRAPCINCAAMSYSYRLSFFFFLLCARAFDISYFKNGLTCD